MFCSVAVPILGGENWQCLPSAVVLRSAPGVCCDRDSRWCLLLAGELLSISSLEDESIGRVEEGEEEPGRAAWQGELVKAQGESTCLESTVGSDLLFAGKPAVFTALSSSL